jgi:hypothetical protein
MSQLVYKVRTLLSSKFRLSHSISTSSTLLSSYSSILKSLVLPVSQQTNLSFLDQIQHARLCVFKAMDHLKTPNAKGSPRTSTPNPAPARTQTQSATEHYPDHGNRTATSQGYPSLHTSGSAVMSQSLGQYYLYLANTEQTALQSSHGAQGSQGQANQTNRGNQGGQGS